MPAEWGPAALWCCASAIAHGSPAARLCPGRGLAMCQPAIAHSQHPHKHQDSPTLLHAHLLLPTTLRRWTTVEPSLPPSQALPASGSMVIASIWQHGWCQGESTAGTWPPFGLPGSFWVLHPLCQHHLPIPSVSDDTGHGAAALSELLSPHGLGQRMAACANQDQIHRAGETLQPPLVSSPSSFPSASSPGCPWHGHTVPAHDTPNHRVQEQSPAGEAGNGMGRRARAGEGRETGRNRWWERGCCL